MSSSLVLPVKQRLPWEIANGTASGFNEGWLITSAWSKMAVGRTVLVRASPSRMCVSCLRYGRHKDVECHLMNFLLYVALLRRCNVLRLYREHIGDTSLIHRKSIEPLDEIRRTSPIIVVGGCTDSLGLKRRRDLIIDCPYLMGSRDLQNVLAMFKMSRLR